jgi:hypothetical protein
MSTLAMYICLQIFIAGVAFMYDNINASYITQHPFFSLGTPASPSLFGEYRASQTAHVTAQNVALPSQVVAALDGDTSLQSQLLRELLGKLPGLLGSAGGGCLLLPPTPMYMPFLLGGLLLRLQTPLLRCLINSNNYSSYLLSLNLYLRYHTCTLHLLFLTLNAAICATSP